MGNFEIYEKNRINNLKQFLKKQSHSIHTYIVYNHPPLHCICSGSPHFE
jgi:hypothetical protein